MFLIMGKNDDLSKANKKVFLPVFLKNLSVLAEENEK
jgi:hypothetical protein